MKIVFVLENYLPHIGGLEAVFRNLCESLASESHNVDIVTHRMKGTKRYEKIRGVHVHRVSCFRSRYLFALMSLPRIWSAAKNADIIHTTTFTAAPPAWLIAKLRRKPVIITVHEVWVGRWRELTEMGRISSGIHGILEKCIYLLPYDRYVGVSNSTAKELKRIGIKERKIRMVYNALDYNHFNPNKYDEKPIRRKFKNSFIVFACGRPGVSKGFKYLIKAFPIIKRKVPKAILLLILSRDPAYTKRYSNLMKLAKSISGITVLNPVSWDILPAYMKAADCVVIPSLSEGFGYAVAEPCAIGTPVVASNVGSIPEVISGKYVLINAKDSKAIAEGVNKVYRKEYVHKALKWFTKKDNMKGYMKIYEEML